MSRNKGIEWAFWQSNTSCLLTGDCITKRKKQISSTYNKVAGDTFWKYVLMFAPEKCEYQNMTLEH